MMVPKSFQHSQRRSGSPTYTDEKKVQRVTTRSMSLSRRKEVVAPPQETTQEQQRPPTPPIAVPHRKEQPQCTAPVPMATRCRPRISPSTQTVRVAGTRADRQSFPKSHRNDALPPAVAALLAVTSIPPRPNHPSRRRTSPNENVVSIDDLVEEWRKDHHQTSSHKVGSPMDILLERPDESDRDDASVEESGNMSSRSISSDSITSLPSLEADEQSVASWGSSNPNTPQSLRRERVLLSPPAESCAADHPLMYSPIESHKQDNYFGPSPVETPRASFTLKASFKSNLTASLQALKSAAKSFSNFTAPSVPPDDFLTRSILSPRYTSEMRPKPITGVPTPAMRRYMNPNASSTPLSPTELSMHIHDTDLELSTTHSPMIQMQTYDRRGGRSKASKRARGQLAPNLEPRIPSADGSPTVRQREPRENSDFLRVIVMEMNMRRQGKLDAKAMGRARLWLPPRQLVDNTTDLAISGKEVPLRWKGVGVDDV